MNDLRRIIREYIKKELQEISVTGAGEAFSTPYAFSRKTLDPLASKKKESDEERINKLPQKKKVNEGHSRYQEFKMDESATVQQKIGRAISEMNRQINELSRVVNMSSRLKVESNLASSGLWKRTQQHLTRLEGKMISLSQRLRELKS
jgi:Skp family chaperone for outer membrane proteins